ncbi:SDR family oxidoreductase [Streptomyces sp. NPDC006235]|uniref:SDR family oxidoreductase n=1 Tax=Streptomyces sp. NPDC006235 TaxID=3156736 RepID=UPI0033BA13BD
MGGTPHTDVVVVGAGPVGLLLAGTLRSHGAQVTVVERNTEPTGESRASTLHARSMEILDDLRLLDRLGPPRPGGTGHFAGLPLDLTAAGATSHPGLWKVPQPRLEAALEEWARELGAQVLRGRRATALDEREDRVTVTTDGAAGPCPVTGRFVVGCDGQHSDVRRLHGFGFPGLDGTRELLRADITGVQVSDRRFERLPNGLAIAARGPDGTTRVMVHAHGSAPRRRPGGVEFAEFAAAWQRVTGEDIGAATPLWLNAFDDTCRQVTHYRRGRVLLAGDAAHVQLPVGGQALNLGLQDAAALGPALAAHLSGRAALDQLDTCLTERHRAGARTLTNIRAQTELLFGGARVEPLRAVFGELLGIAPARRHLADRVSGLDTRPEPAPRSAPRTPEAHPISDGRTRTTMERLTDRTALVTGASRGIGRAVAVRLAREGALVAVHYATGAEAAAETVAAIEKEGGRAFTVQAELGAAGDVHELFLGLERGLKERTGHTRLDILVNNAGIMGGSAPEDVTVEHFDRLMAVNARAPFFIVQRALTLMPDGGRIVNISSGLTRFANPGEVAYAMTKGAVEQLTLHYAKHLGPRRITVNTVAPGITDNGSPVFDDPDAVAQMAQLSAFGRVGEAGDVADVVTFLTTDEARWITGAFIDATGGTLLG